MPRTLNISVIVAEIEAVRNRDAIVDFSRKGAGCISLIVCQVLCQGVVRLEIQTVAQPMRRVHLKRLIVLSACVEGAVKREPVRVWSSRIDVRTSGGSTE